ncbi:MAG: glycosyltransferase family 2 protein [Oleiphilaceae bacterium]|nr:glycosyltransferase family 2 protein [Oleiphilaceae bacterium]
MPNPEMPSLTVALIIKNEELNLSACLKTVADWVDEIVIVDSGSTDKSEDIAKRFGAKFYRHEDWQGFGKQRQIAQSYITSDYVLWLDADERVTPELKRSIQTTLKTDPSNTLYQVSRLSYVFGRYIRHCGWYPDRVTRLYRVNEAAYDDARVHEKVVVPGGANIAVLDGDLIHFTYRDLHHYLTKSAGYAKAWADERRERGKRASVTQAVLHALTCFLKMYVLKAGFLDGKQGFVLSALSAHSTFIKYVDLWTRDQDLVPKDATD